MLQLQLWTQRVLQVSCGGTNLSLSQPTAPDLGEARLQVKDDGGGDDALHLGKARFQVTPRYVGAWQNDKSVSEKNVLQAL